MIKLDVQLLIDQQMSYAARKWEDFHVIFKQKPLDAAELFTASTLIEERDCSVVRITILPIRSYPSVIEMIECHVS